MKIEPLLLAKVILTVAVLLLVGTLAVLKLIPPEQVTTLTVAIVGALVVALGLTAAGRAAGAGTPLTGELLTAPAVPADPAARLASLEQAVAALAKAASSPATPAIPGPPKLPGGAGGFARVSVLAHVAVLVFAALAVVLVLSLADAMIGCSATPSAVGAAVQAQGAQVNEYSDKLAHCRAVGREAGSDQAYTTCEKEAGL